MTTAARIGARWPWADRHGIRSTCGPRCPTPSAELADQWVRPLRQRADEQALHDLMVNADYGLTPKEISAIKLPTSIIWGSHDHQGGSLRATITNLHHPPVHIIEGAGHLTMLADPQAFVRAVEG